jgi:hypothetical protein
MEIHVIPPIASLHALPRIMRISIVRGTVARSLAAKISGTFAAANYACAIDTLEEKGFFLWNNDDIVSM